MPFVRQCLKMLSQSTNLKWQPNRIILNLPANMSPNPWTDSIISNLPSARMVLNMPLVRQCLKMLSQSTNLKWQPRRIILNLPANMSPNPWTDSIISMLVTGNQNLRILAVSIFELPSDSTSFTPILKSLVTKGLSNRRIFETLLKKSNSQRRMISIDLNTLLNSIKLKSNFTKSKLK
jgi:hypothetical protein